MKNNNFKYPYELPLNDHAHHYPYKDGVYPMHHHGWNDTMGAHVVEPYEHCWPYPEDDCICVTSADAVLWNGITAVSSYSGIDMKPLADLSGLDIKTSADIWNNTYETVSANSAIWNESGKIEELKDYTNSAISDISAYLKNIEYLSTVNVDKKTQYPYNIVGNGSTEWPLALSEHIVDLLYYVEHGTVRPKTHGSSQTQSVPNPMPFALNTDFAGLKSQVNELSNLINTNSVSITELSKIIKGVLTLITTAPSAKPDVWVNKKVTLDRSTASGDIFFYW